MANKKKKILPSFTWLTRNRQYGLIHAIIRYPEQFKDFEIANIPQERKMKYIAFATDLTKNNNGKLPTNKWIINNFPKGSFINGNTFCAYKRNHKSVFKKFNQEYDGGNSLSQNVKKAETIAFKNDGVLPNYQELRKISKAIVSSMRDHPEAYSHIPQKKKLKTFDECRVILKELEDEKGIVPSPNWLQTKGYKWLAARMLKNMSEFKGIKQEYRNGVRIIGE